MMELSIIIPCYNNVELTLECLEHIRESELPATHEVILVDDGSWDGTLDIEKGRRMPFIDTCIRHYRNMGFSRSCNDAIRLARGDSLAIFSNDMFVSKNWYLAQKPFLGRSIMYKRQRFDIEWVSSELIGPGCTVEGTREDFEKLRYLPVDKDPHFRLFGIGGPWLFTPRVFSWKVGTFDERYFPAWWEDIDFKVRCLREGVMFVALEDSFAYHVGSQTAKLFPHLGDAGAINPRNKARFAEKWGVPYTDFEAGDIDWEAIAEEQVLVIKRGDHSDRYSG